MSVRNGTLSRRDVGSGSFKEGGVRSLSMGYAILFYVDVGMLRGGESFPYIRTVDLCTCGMLL
jgi:hypothetical protein